ncbi:DUF3006 domain-containing protein [Halalkalibacterium ligniniphilum]|uniref:DUF3006 domain-containing protein n=1 Tax=Halalkalibacterium ligniniphilum TaxID=1134413 RepID=UPI00034D5BEF|nr:DUF3006 domain-containing protein [Halalkalibacterium ligniniphilum]
MDKYTLDRFVDGQTAVLLLRDNESVQKDVSIKQLPSNVKEGDILEIQFNVDGSIKKANVLKKETDAAIDKAKSLLEKLKKKNQK